MTILTVGPGRDFATLSAAIAASAAGDTIRIDAGTYIDDFATITHPLTIQGVGGMAHLLAQAQPPNGKAILTVAADLAIDHLEFSGATVPDGNGAGIRYEGGNLTITNSWFHNNENGLLAAPVAGGTIAIDRSEFSNNGAGDGKTHNLYVNDIARLTITNSYFHDVSVGHEIKSRARETVITGNRIADGPALSASYSIDLPDGGAATVTGNIIEKGANAQNRTFIHLGGERVPSYDNTTLVIEGNTFVNSQTAGPPTVLRNDSSVGGANAPATITGNTFHAIAPGQLAIGSAGIGTNSFPAGPAPAIDTSHPFGDGAPCFLRGSRLATPGGPVAVERLAAGDAVLTADGGTARLRWVGRRRLDGRRHPRPWDVLPVRIRAGAIRPGQPARDLLLSPDHALFLDGVLVPVRALVNGATVVQEPAGMIAYHHVELAAADGGARHGIVLAEGLPVETYLDTGNRSAFEGEGAALALHPDFARARWATAGCAPLAATGPAVVRIRRRLLARAAVLGHRLSADPLLVLEVAGRRLPIGTRAGSATLALPAAAHGVLRSRRFVPADSDPASEDRRQLGVAVRALVLDGIALDLAGLGGGWHPTEPHQRWTDGAGVVPLGGARQIRIVFGSPGRYREPPAAQRARA